MSKFVVMSSPSDSEKTTSEQVYISENSHSSASSSSRNPDNVIDLETEISDSNRLDIVPFVDPSVGRKTLRSRKSSLSGKYLKIYDSRYQEWVDAGSSPSTSSGRKYNPQINNAPYACKTGGLPTSRANILNDVKETHLRVLEISKMPSLYYFDPRVPFRLPEVGEALDSWSSDTISLSFESFRYVNPFPLPNIALDLCVFYEISPSQLSPHAWRLIAMAELMYHEIGVDLDMFDLFGSYKLQEIRTGVYSFIQAKEGLPTWTFGSLPNDRQWDVRFVMVPFQSVAQEDYVSPMWRRLSKSSLQQYFSHYVCHLIYNILIIL